MRTMTVADAVRAAASVTRAWWVEMWRLVCRRVEEGERLTAFVSWRAKRCAWCSSMMVLVVVRFGRRRLLRLSLVPSCSALREERRLARWLRLHVRYRVASRHGEMFGGMWLPDSVREWSL